MTQQEIENVLREFNAELQSERSKKIDQIEKAHLMKVQAIDAELSAKIAELEIERDKAQEEMMSAKIAWINAGTDEQKTAMQCQFERVRFEQEKKCRHIRARIEELKRIARVDQARAVSDRDKLMRDNNERFATKYNAKRAELYKELTPSPDKDVYFANIYKDKLGIMQSGNLYESKEQADDYALQQNCGSECYGKAKVIIYEKL